MKVVGTIITHTNVVNESKPDRALNSGLAHNSCSSYCDPNNGNWTNDWSQWLSTVKTQIPSLLGRVPEAGMLTCIVWFWYRISCLHLGKPWCSVWMNFHKREVYVETIIRLPMSLSDTNMVLFLNHFIPCFISELSEFLASSRLFLYTSRVALHFLLIYVFLEMEGSFLAEAFTVLCPL